jgi:O-acetyl-ADP-ribose deacetylase
MVSRVKGNIVDIEADVIVNAANTELKHSGGVAKAIARAAGDQLKEQSKPDGFVPFGSFAVTAAGKLKSKIVLHIPTIDYIRRPGSITYQALEKAWRSALKFCHDEGYKKVAAPLLGTGVAGLDKERVSKMMENVGREFTAIDLVLVEK